MVQNLRFFFSNLFCKPIFICGISGSGTTLLSALMDQYFLNACTLHESALQHPEFSPLKVKSLGEYTTLENYYKKACYFFPNIDLEDIRNKSLSLYLEKSRKFFVRNVFDKAPNVHLGRAEFLLKAFPNARFLTIFKNPQANIEGLRRKWNTLKEVPLEDLCAFWCGLHDSFQRFVETYGPPVLYIEYEHFVDQPGEELNRIQNKFGLKLRKEIYPYPDKPGNPGKGLHHVRKGKISVNNSGKNKWKEQLDSEEISQIGALTQGTYHNLLLNSKR